MYIRRPKTVIQRRSKIHCIMEVPTLLQRRVLERRLPVYFGHLFTFEHLCACAHKLRLRRTVQNGRSNCVPCVLRSV